SEKIPGRIRDEGDFFGKTGRGGRKIQKVKEKNGARGIFFGRATKKFRGVGSSFGKRGIFFGETGRKGRKFGR
ncbi:MAG: hypothetical protein NC324_06055, partial [Bacteroides sp.]|nr:hypothetical protein [Bacteroides sp.]